MNDHGADPVGDGTFRMVPSGEVVSLEERNKRLANKRQTVSNQILGMSWAELERKQGGKLKHPKR